MFRTDEIELKFFRHNAFRRMNAMEKTTIPFYELTVLIKGRMTYVVDGVEYPLESGDAVSLRSGSTRSRYEVNGCDYVSFNFFLPDNADAPFPVLTRRYVNADVLAFVKILDNVSLGNFENAAAKERLALGYLLLLLEERSRSSKNGKLVFQIKKLLVSNLGRRLTLAEIGRQTFFSPVYCDTVFKKETGFSIIEYFNKLKIEEAKKLIVERADSLTEIALKLGFEDYNYFSRLFKKHTGYSPKQYQH